MLNFSAALIKATLAIYMALKEVPLEVCVRMFLQINHEIVRVFLVLKERCKTPSNTPRTYVLFAILSKNIPKCSSEAAEPILFSYYSISIMKRFQ